MAKRSIVSDTTRTVKTRLKVSIVVPSFNQAKYIRRTLNSLVSEAGEVDLEVIVQDAGSTDGTHDILDEFRQHSFIKMFIEPDSGQTDALNKGFRRASGQILGWLNSDDILLDGSMKSVVNVFQENPGIDLVYGDALFIDENDKILEAYPTGELSLEVLRHRCVISQPSTFFTSESYKRYGALRDDLHYCMDYEYWTRLLVNGACVARLRETVSCTRIHGETKTSNGGIAFINEIVEMQEVLLGKASPVWRVYQKTRSAPLKNLSNKSLRFAIAATQQFLMTPAFIFSACGSVIERRMAVYRSRKLLKRFGQQIE